MGWSTIASFAAFGFQAGSQIIQGNAAADAANYQAQVARNNQIIADRQAAAERDAGVAAEQDQRRKTAALMGTQRATLAANGLDLGSGSALDLQASAAELGELDALTIRSNANRRAWAYETQGTNYAAQAGLYGTQASQTRLSGYLNAANSIIGGATSTSSRWDSYRSANTNPRTNGLF